MDLTTDQLTVEHISLLYTVFKRVQNGKMVQIPNIVLNNLWVENITRSKAMREQINLFINFDTTFDDINTLKQELQLFVQDPANSRDFHSDIEVEVVGIAEMNKLELRVEIRHKSNWSNEALRAARRSKFMCALVVALRKIPIYGPGGGDAALGDAGKPSWSVSISPEEAIKAREKFNEDKDAKRLYPPKKDEPEDHDQAKASGNDYLHPEHQAINTLNSRAPGADPIRDDTWKTRDDVSTIGRPSMDGRPELEEVRGLLHKESSKGKRKQLMTTTTEQSQTSQSQSSRMPSIPIPIIPSPQYAAPPQRQPSGPTSPSSISTGHIEEFQYQSMAPPPRAVNRPAVAVESDENNPFPSESQRAPQPPRTLPGGSTSNYPYPMGPHDHSSRS